MLVQDFLDWLMKDEIRHIEIDGPPNWLAVRVLHLELLADILFQHLMMAILRS